MKELLLECLGGRGCSSSTTVLGCHVGRLGWSFRDSNGGAAHRFLFVNRTPIDVFVGDFAEL